MTLPAIPEDTLLPLVSNPSHKGCVVCGCENDHGMRVEFRSQSDGSVVAEFPCDAAYQGYQDVLHGGVVATLLDGAMTNCLFAHHIVAVTAELTIRYLHPVRIGDPVSIKAWIVRSSPHLHLLAAELAQEGRVHARAKAKFRNVMSATSQQV